MLLTRWRCRTQDQRANSRSQTWHGDGDEIPRERRQPCQEGAAGTGPRRLGPALRRPACERGDDRRIVPELTPGDAEPLVEKNYGDSFEDTALESVLSDLCVGRLVVIGAQTDACIRSTLHGALVRGYDATLVSDAHRRRTRRHGGAAAGPGHRALEPVLDLPDRAAADGRDGRDQGHPFRRHVLSQAHPRAPTITGPTKHPPRVFRTHAPRAFPAAYATKFPKALAKVTEGPGSRSAGLAMALTLIEVAQTGGGR
jgi:nicotinamidase-related amidase